MRRHNFTINEMLAVIAIIMVLSALIFPMVTSSRAQARLTSCASNQGQVMKMLQDGMSRAKDQLISADDDKDSPKRLRLWTTSLYERNIMRSMDGMRCPELTYTHKGTSADQKADRAEAYGVVYASADADGKLDFRGSKLRKYTKSGKTIDIAPNHLLIGGCTATDYGSAKANAVLDFSGGKLISVHRKQLNVFFLDGSSSTVVEREFPAWTENVYFPKADNSAAESLSTRKSDLLTK